MANSQTSLLNPIDSAEKASTSLIENPKENSIESSLQANADWGKLAQMVKDALVWAWNHKAEIASAIGGLQKIKDFIVSTFSPKGTEEYKSMTENGRKSVDKYASAIRQAFQQKDKAGFTSNLKLAAKVYEQQSLMTTDANVKAKLEARAKQLVGFADNIENDVIPMDPEFSDRIKDGTKKSYMPEDFEANDSMEVLNSTMEGEKSLIKSPLPNPQLWLLDQALEKLLTSTLKILNVAKLTDGNGSAVAKKMLELGASKEVVEQVFTAYYENVKDMSHRSSEERAKEVVENAYKSKDNEASPMLKNDEAKSASYSQGMGGM
jgi:hypothetical protein